MEYLVYCKADDNYIGFESIVGKFKGYQWLNACNQFLGGLILCCQSRSEVTDFDEVGERNIVTNVHTWSNAILEISRIDATICLR